jgi:DNA-binding transcriptional MerR regulator
MSADQVVPDKDEFKIGEVCDIAGVKPFVLRYWETEFPQLAPAKGAGGQRTYSRQDVDLILHIKRLLYEERFTVAGAKMRLAEEADEAEETPETKPKSKAKAKPAGKATKVEEPELDSAAGDKVQHAKRVLGEVRRELETIMESLR